MKANNGLAKFFKNYNYAWKFKLIVCLPIFLGLVAFDWITKGIVQGTMNQGDIKSFMPGFIDIRFIINPGSAYGVNANNLALAVSLATIMTIILLVVLVFVNGKQWLVGLTIVFAGSFANLLARAWAPAVTFPTDTGLVGVKGGVIDFLHWQFSFFGSDNYIFNLADLWVIFGVVAIVIGAIVELIMILVKKSKETETLNQESQKLQDSKEKNHKDKKSSTKFVYRDVKKMNPTERKQYEKELKAYEKMKKIESKADEKKTRKPRK